MANSNQIPDIATSSEPQSTDEGLIPARWVTERLGHLADIKYGKANPKSSGKIPVVGSGGIYAWTDAPLVSFPTIVIGRKGTAGSVQLFEDGCYPADTTFYLEWKAEVSIRYLFYFMLAHPLSGEHAKTTLPSIQRPDLENLSIAFPPPREQRAIAHTLSRLQAASEAQATIAERARELKRALMARLFTEGLYGDDQKETEIGLVPTAWDIAKLGDRVKVQSGGTPSRSNPTYWGGTIPWVKTGEIDYNIIAQTEEHITPAGLANSSAKLFPAGTLLMAMYGQGVTRGRVAILGIEAATNQACAALFPDSTLTAQYLFTYLTYAYERVRNFAHGAQQKNLSGEIIKALKIPVPPVDQQREIARIISAIDSRIVAAERKQAGLDELFQTLLKELMTGRVRTVNR